MDDQPGLRQIWTGASSSLDATGGHRGVTSPTGDHVAFGARDLISQRELETPASAETCAASLEGDRSRNVLATVSLVAREALLPLRKSV